MSFSFNSEKGLIVVPVELHGPSGIAILKMAIDTGATTSLVNTALLVSIGYDPALESERLQVTTGSSIEFLPLIKLDKIIALDQERKDFPVLCHTLPSASSVDGLLGLDFLRGHKLTIDFRKGEIEIELSWTFTICNK